MACSTRFFIPFFCIFLPLQSMKNKEIEYKIQLLAHEHFAFEQKLEKDNLVTCKGMVHQKDTYFKTISKNSTLRIRESSKGNSICLKKTIDLHDAHTYREEYETSIGNVQTLSNILFELDHQKELTINKTRTVYLIDGLEIAFDVVTELGLFIEIEVKKEITSKEEAIALIEKFLKKYEVTQFKLFTESYYTIASHHNKSDFEIEKKLE